MTSKQEKFQIILKNSDMGSIPLSICCDTSLKEYLEKYLSPYMSLKKTTKNLKESWCILTTSKDINGKYVYIKAYENLDFYISLSSKYIFTVLKNKTYHYQSILRFIRDFVRCYLEEELFFFHGGMVSYKGKGILIIGGKKAGKTTTIINCLLNNYQYITNDDVSLTRKGTSYIAHGWPRSISVRKDTLDSFSFKQNCKFLNPDNKKQHLSKDYIYIYPEELQFITKSQIRNNNKVSCIVLPYFDNSLSDSEISLVEQTKAKDALWEHIDFNVNKYFSEFSKIFNFKKKPSEDYLNLLESLIQDIPVYKLSQNKDTLNSSINYLERILD